MRGKLLRTFLEVAECGSFSKAEKNLFLSKQAIVKQIDNLEKDLGFALFYRSSQGVSLTPAGSHYKDGVKELLSYSEKLLEECTQIASLQPVLRIENQRRPQLLLQGVLNTMIRKHPEIKLEILFSNDHHSGDRILNGELDLAEVPQCKEIHQPGLAYTKLVEIPYHCLVHEQHPLAQQSEILPEDLNGCTIVVNNPKYRHKIINYINQHTTEVTFEKGYGEEIEQIYTACYNNDIYISTIFSLDQLPNIKAIPIKSDLAQEFGLIYRENPSDDVTSFLTIATQYYKPKR